jgi:adenine deaminase
MVFHKGKLVAQKGKPLFSSTWRSDPKITHSVNIKPFGIEALKIPASRKNLPIIELVPGQVTTKSIKLEPKVRNGFVVPDIERDILKLVVVERHKASAGLIHSSRLAQYRGRRHERPRYFHRN